MSEKKQKHTGGTWVALEECVWAEFPQGGKVSIATTKGYFWDETTARANAARIVQCVNACAGIEDPVAHERSSIEQACESLRMAADECGDIQIRSCYEAALSALTPKEEKPQ